MKTQLLKFFLILPIVLFFQTPTNAMVITKVKDKKVAIRLEGADVSVGDILTAYQDGKKKAFVKITKVKGGKALGEILKGRAAADMTLEPRSASASAGKSRRHARGKKGNLSVGVLGGMSMDSLSMTISGVNIEMSGSGMNVGLGVDYNFSKSIGARAALGMNNFVVTGTNNLNASVSFIELAALLRYTFNDGDMRFWVGAGPGFYFASSSSNNFVAQFGVDINTGTTVSLMAAAGMDWQITDSLYIPVQVDYDYILYSDSKWSMISIRTGLLYRF